LKPVILLVDDEDTIRLFLEKTLREEGYEALTAATGAAAIELTRSELPDLVLLDLKLPDMSGLEVLKQIKEEVPEACVIMLTAFGDIETAVTAMKKNAFD
jgi:DNA-binding NtrC family response regulator